MLCNSYADQFISLKSSKFLSNVLSLGNERFYSDKYTHCHGDTLECLKYFFYQEKGLQSSFRFFPPIETDFIVHN